MTLFQSFIHTSAGCPQNILHTGPQTAKTTTSGNRSQHCSISEWHQIPMLSISRKAIACPMW